MEPDPIQLQLVSYLYNELTPTERTAVEERMKEQPELRKTFEEMCQTKRQFLSSSLLFSPSESVIDNILQHSHHALIC